MRTQVRPRAKTPHVAEEEEKCVPRIEAEQECMARHSKCIARHIMQQ